MGHSYDRHILKCFSHFLDFEQRWRDHFADFDAIYDQWLMYFCVHTKMRRHKNADGFGTSDAPLIIFIRLNVESA